MLADMMKSLMSARGLRQKDLAEIMEISLSRVKHLTAGNAQKLTREEGKLLIDKLGVSSRWLATGEGDIFQNAEEQRITDAMNAADIALHRSAIEGLSDDQRALLQRILFALERGKKDDLINDLLKPLSPDESTLLDNYRKMTDEQRRILLETSAAFVSAQGKPE